MFGVQRIFICLGSKETEQIEQKMKKWDDIGHMLVSGALDDTKKMRKLGADSFPKSPA